MKRFFIFCSGANTSVLAECPSEVTKYAGIGATIFFTALFAGISGGYALFTVFESYWVSLPFGAVWALMIFNLDRVIVSGMRKQRDYRHDLLFASPRILLAILLAFVISKPLELRLFEKEISAQIARTNNEQYLRTVNTVDAGYGALVDLGRQNQVLKLEIREKQKEVAEAYQAWIDERAGIAGTGIPGPGSVYREKGLRLAEVKSQLATLEKRNLAQVSQNEAKIAKLEESRQAQIAAETLAQTRANGFLARLEALSQLNRAHPGVRSASWLITLLFITLEVAPVAVKLMSTLNPYRPYDQKLEDLEMRVVESSEQQRAVLRSRLGDAARKEIAEFRGAVDADLVISSSKIEQRRQAELSANEELMQKIAAAQTEIVERIVEEWKRQELEKLDGNVRSYVNVE